MLYLLIADKGRQRPLWITLAIFWLIPTAYFSPRYFGLQWAHMPMFSMILILPLCDVIHRVLQRLDRAEAPWNSAGRIVFRLLIVAIPISTQPILARAAYENDLHAEQEETRETTEPCRVGAVRPQLESAFADAGAPRLMALPELSGQLRYHLDAEVFAIGKHRRQPGFLRMLVTFASTDMAEVEQRLREFQADGIVVCSSHGLGRGYFRDIQADDYFYARLQEGDAPPYLREVPLDTTGLKVYRID